MSQLTAMIESERSLLITGPTGSQDDAYAALNRLNDGTRTINTIEDPISTPSAGCVNRK
jgi:type II secretory ATPase GspE/PulE/Tfp pilus assembly ATPase PilB-like protein